MDSNLIALVRDWSKSISSQQALESCCKIAQYLSLPLPTNLEESRNILQVVDEKYPYAYYKATEETRQHWVKLYPFLSEVL